MEKKGLVETLDMLTCPFCSGPNIRVSDFDRIAQVECDDCGARGPTEVNDYITGGERHKNAIASWNSILDVRTVAGAWALPEN